jgi:GxxExxY protein
MEGLPRKQERDPQTYAIIGAAIEVHKVLGNGFLEAVYQEALAEEFQQRGIPFAEQVELPISYKGKLLTIRYRPDFVAFENIVVEIKALDMLTSREKAQLLNYLKASGFHRGLLINFGARSLQYERLVWGRS